MSLTIPEGMTDPDEIDRYLEARDARTLQTAAQRDADDAAVMATIPRRNLYAVPDLNTRKAIAARIAYDQKPFWQRLRLTLAGERPPGLVDRYPTRPMSVRYPTEP